MTYCKHCGIDSATVVSQARMIEDRDMEIAELKERLHQETILVVPGTRKLTPAEAAMTSLLLTRDFCSKMDLFLCYEHKGGKDGPRSVDPRVVDVSLCRIRQKLAPLGIEIKTIWGKGYMIERANRDVIIAKLEAA